jgi:hypothetical protein
MLKEVTATTQYSVLSHQRVVVVVDVQANQQIAQVLMVVLAVVAGNGMLVQILLAVLELLEAITEVAALVECSITQVVAVAVRVR